MGTLLSPLLQWTLLYLAIRDFGNTKNTVNYWRITHNDKKGLNYLSGGIGFALLRLSEPAIIRAYLSSATFLTYARRLDMSTKSLEFGVFGSALLETISSLVFEQLLRK